MWLHFFCLYRFLAQASHLYDSSLITCVNYIFSTTLAIVAGRNFSVYISAFVTGLMFIY